MLMNIIGSEEEALEEFPLGADGYDLAARILELVRIVRQAIEVQSEPRKLRAIKIAQTSSNRNIASR